MPDGKENDRVEQECDEERQDCGFVELIDDDSAAPCQMSDNLVDDADEGDVKPDDDEGAHGDVGDGWPPDSVQCFAAVEHAEEETEVDGVEEGNVEDESPCMVGLQVPMEKQNAGHRQRDAQSQISPETDISEQVFPSHYIAYIIIR